MLYLKLNCMLFLSLSHQKKKKKKKKSITCCIEDFNVVQKILSFPMTIKFNHVTYWPIYMYTLVPSPSIQISINNSTKEANGCASSTRDFMTTLESPCKIPWLIPTSRENSKAQALAIASTTST